MNDKFKTGLNVQDSDQRIIALEEEVADLKRQLEDQPECIRISLSAFKFDNPAFDPNNLSKEHIKQLNEYLEREIQGQRFIIRIPW